VLAEVTRSFVTHAASYGFTIAELNAYLSELGKTEG